MKFCIVPVAPFALQRYETKRNEEEGGGRECVCERTFRREISARRLAKTVYPVELEEEVRSGEWNVAYRRVYPRG